MRKIIHVLCIFVLFLIHHCVYAEFTQSWLDNQVQLFVKDKPVKAMIYGLWVDGKPISTNAIGQSMTNVPVTDDMHFRIGGITETMLTTVLMQLVEQKKLQLDDNIAQWYPNLPNAASVTLKMLANGTSGYPDYVYNKKFVDAVINHPFKNWSDKELLDYALMQKPLFKPGTNQHYSHTDYVLLGSILSKVSNKSVNELFEEAIFNKLAMNNTRFERTANMPYPVLHSFSQDRHIYEDSTFWDPSWTSTSGATVSTIQDLGLWANAWMKGSLLSEQSTQQLRAPETVGKGQNTSALYFAMGFGVVNHWLIQNPRFGGYSGIFSVLPEKNIVFIAFNTLKPAGESNINFSMALWQKLAAKLAPEYPQPFK
ncbi:serine hydrolase domain-containing protein [Legionella fallonii]|uniref:D-alanyl-D-alanine carboxypeptidase. DD-peptidase. DD-transpeptidase n=1 Tax=Legionella fallonii LLAP-10 TaxID=1212491 RepID=A0A098G2P9_9GAMM|nr:serine hydrolase domain-containing protein [Legionella fallonii]CEG56264.1 D-alanyl-D-alanine carboxypeptidase. DD-peptidase. DD-transpeptidase [Legionella fallonii LLAP-10]